MIGRRNRDAAAISRGVFVRISELQRWVILGALALVGALVAIAAIRSDRPGHVAITISFASYLILLGLPFIIRRQEVAWFHPLIFFVLWWLVVRGILPSLSVYTIGLEHHVALAGRTPAELNNVVLRTTLLDVLALIATYVGFYGAGRLPTFGLRFPPPQHVFLKVLVVTVVSVGAFLMLVRLAGGLGALLLQRGLPETMRVQALVGGGHWHFLVGLLVPACLTWLAVKPEVWGRLRFWALFLLSLALGFGATGSRSGVVFPAIIALGIWMLHNRRVPIARALILGGMGLFLVGVLGEFRMESRGARSLEEVQVDAGLAEGVRGGLETLSSYASTISGPYAIVGKVPEEVDLLYGRSYLSIPAAPVPRALWSEKPQAGGKLTATHIFNNPLSAVPPRSVGEAYWNFHVPGVAVIFVLWGVFLKWLTRFHRQNATEPALTVLVLLTLFYLQPNSPAFYEWLHAFGPAVLFLVLFAGAPRVRV